MLKRNADRILIVSVLLLVALGVVMVYSTSFMVALEKYGDKYFFVKKHIVYTLMGFAAFFVALKLPYRVYRTLAPVLFVVAVVLLFLIFVPGVGHKVGGARRWIDAGLIRFQPSEVAKLSMVVFMAYLLEKKKDKIKDFYSGFLPCVVLPAIPIGLVMAEPDFGTSVTMAMLLLFMAFIGGVRASYIGGLVVASLPVVYVVITSFDYMTRRIVAFLDPWKDPGGAGFQIIQSFLAFGSGGLSGVGLGEGRLKLFYLPEAHTDFIFSIIGEELGLIGVTAVIVLYGGILLSGMVIAKNSKELFGTYLAAGITLMLTLQALINMAVVLGMLPPKGLPLPFLSYGGTSLMVSLAAVGILLNIYAAEGDR
ncbi:MAG TPA: putative lipid II flippase FtsW [Deltaproteobacteria bacterium]|nr:putative lipid II flippase FtsW [Deltaproteobacteria bacterium]